MTQVQTISSEGITTKIDYDGGENPVYIGEALPGTATDNARWRIKRLTYDGNENVTDIQWAAGEAIKFTVTWDDRASHSYS